MGSRQRLRHDRIGLEDFLDGGVEIECWDMRVVVAEELPWQELWGCLLWNTNGTIETSYGEPVELSKGWVCRWSWSQEFLGMHRGMEVNW